jgi:hypothetical protein
MAADFDAAVVGAGGLEGLQFLGWGVVEIAFDVIVQGGLVVLDGEQVIGAAIEDGGSDLGLAPYGVDSLPRWRPGVTSAPCSSRRSSSRGMAVISLDLMSVAS